MDSDKDLLEKVSEIGVFVHSKKTDTEQTYLFNLQVNLEIR